MRCPGTSTGGGWPPLRVAGRWARSGWSAATPASRCHTYPTDFRIPSTPPILAAARRLVTSANPTIAERGLTLIGFAVSGIDRTGAQQLMLPFGAESLALDAAVDQVRRRYGKSALTRAVLVGRDLGFEMPHLPD